jgi:hypothetical protein
MARRTAGLTVEETSYESPGLEGPWIWLCGKKACQAPQKATKALDHWAYWNQVKLDFSRPGKPTDNPVATSSPAEKGSKTNPSGGLALGAASYPTSSSLVGKTAPLRGVGAWLRAPLDSLLSPS